MDTMSENSFRRQHSALLVNMRVIPGTHIKMVHLLYFFAIFREMSLEIRVKAGRHFRCAAHQFFRASHGKARAKSVFEPAVFGAMPFSAKPLTFKQRNRN